MKHAHNFSYIFKVVSDIIFSFPTASLIPFPLLNPKPSFQAFPQFSFQTFFLSILATIFVVCAMRRIFRWKNTLKSINLHGFFGLVTKDLLQVT
jgi:hypothetical protein